MGQRIIKTAAAVFVCLVIDMLRGGRGDVGSSIVTAIICMQPFLEDTKTFALDRIFGTVLGAMWALAFLLLMELFPVLGTFRMGVYGLMALFVVLAIYSTVVIKKSKLASLVAIVLMSTIVAFPDVNSPVEQTLGNLADTIIGTVVAICVNVFHLPRRKHPEYLFFVRTMDLGRERVRQIPSSVRTPRARLYPDGAKICLVSRWAPAFIISQMGLLNVNAPMIIMDGAALYDIRENKYLDVVPIPRKNAERLCAILESLGVGVNLYAVNERTMTVCHQGPRNLEERRECDEMKRSPYRHYADGMPRQEDKIAFLRVIDTTARIAELEYELKSVLPTGMFRMVVRKDDKYESTSGLFFYDPAATVENMKRRVLEEMTTDTELKPVELFPGKGKYLPEHDALMLLNRLKTIYEPVTLLPRKKKKPQ